MKLGSETGSLFNHYDAIRRQPQPEVGMGATVLLWTDRYPATIVKVTATQVHVKEDHAVRVDSNGMSETQEYNYSPNLDAPVRVFRRTKRGYRDKRGCYLAIGHREKYHDYSF